MRKLNQKGSILIFLTLAFALLGTFIGFAVDFGRAYLQKARISRLVDAAALAAAKALKGQAVLKMSYPSGLRLDGNERCSSGHGRSLELCRDYWANLTVTLQFPVLRGPGRPADKTCWYRH